MKEAQIVKDNRDPLGKLVIVEGEGKEALILFDLADQEEPSERTEPFKVKKIIE